MPKIPKLSQYLAEAEMDFDRDREREEDEGDEPEGEESHRHRLIPFPANATALDTEDYDWYKFGVAASDLDDADPKQFGQGDSDIIVVPFGNEDAERLLPLLKRTGIPLKRLGAEDRPEVTKESLADGYRQVMEYLKKVKGRWALVSKSTGRPLQYYRGPKDQRPSDEWVKDVERRMHSFEQFTDMELAIMEGGSSLEDYYASLSEDAAGVGVVANKKQARDPRYVMSITKDVQPGEPARQAAKFGNKLDKNGLPPLLTDGIDIDQWVEYQLKEDASAGGTSAGSVAVVSAPIGSIFARDPMAGQSKKRLKKQIRSIYEFKMPNYGGDGDDGFSEETLKKLAAQWWNGDEDPKIEQVLALSGWEIGQDEGYDLGGAFVVQAGDVNGNSYMSWPAEELEAMAESKIFEAYGLSDPTYRDTNLKLNRYRNPNDPETGYDNDRFQSNLHKMNFELADIVDELIEKGIKPEVVVVDPDELYASQDWLNDHGSGEDSFYDYTDLPVVVRIDNEMYIADGHHRVSRAKSQGKKIRVYVFDKNKLNEGWREKIAAGALGAAAVLGGQQIDRYLNTDMATKPTAQQLAQKPATPREILEKTAKAAGLVGQEFVQFMAQCSHESLNFTRMTEIGTPQYFAKKYDKKFAPKTAKILGNKLPGDGELFKGRGFIQLTGRDNYMRAGKALGLDLINNPDQASEPNTAAKIAVWYWTNRVAPKVDSFHDTKAVTKKINRAAKHLKQRQNQVQKMQMTYDEPTQPSKQGKV